MQYKLIFDESLLQVNTLEIDPLVQADPARAFVPDTGYSLRTDTPETWWLKTSGDVYKGYRTSLDDVSVTAKPNGTVTTPAQTITLPTGDVTLPARELSVTHTWDGTQWVADLAALRVARLALIRQDRDMLLTISDRFAKDSISPQDGSINNTLRAQIGSWTLKLRDVPAVATTALAALETAAEIAAYSPDLALPAPVVILTARQFLAGLALSGFITEAEALDRGNIPASIEAVFNVLPTTPDNQQAVARITWANMTVI